jgi:UDP-GlcNAc:undecaprenyl-phosphate GlcNAc-1-phosphate transferase
MDLGLSPRQTLILLVCGAAICAAAGLALEAIPAYLSLLCYFLVFGTHCLFVIKSEAIGAYLNARR